MTSVVVLGAGRVGAEVARDLAATFEVTAVDRDAALLDAAFVGTSVETKVADLKEPQTLRDVIEAGDLIVEALPGALGFRALKTVVDAGKDVVDIAFYAEDPFELDELAKERGVTAIVDFGVAPGMSHAVLGYEARHLRVDHYSCMVGGLPVVRTWPFEYKASWSPADVFQEYIRPARYRVNGMALARSALSEPTLVEFEEVGTLEAFLTDGLRTLLRTQDVPNMEERTLRYPGHANLMKVLQAAGFFDTKPIQVGDARVSPLDFTSALLVPDWTYEEGEEDLTVMRVAMVGDDEEGETRAITWDLVDRAAEGVSSMARTTGYPCAAAVHLLATGLYSQVGVQPPERVGADEACFEFLLRYQHERGVVYERSSR